MPKAENRPTVVVRVIRPELTPEERARRMDRIKEAAARLMIAAENERRKK